MLDIYPKVFNKNLLDSWGTVVVKVVREAVVVVGVVVVVVVVLVVVEVDVVVLVAVASSAKYTLRLYN